MTISYERLRHLLRYCPDTGVFTKHDGKLVGRVNVHGYVRVSVDGSRYLAHRLAWLYMIGEWPEEEIDHLNGIKTDNRWCNLRQANRSQNLCNTATSDRNTSGIKGVSWGKRDKVWSAYVSFGGVTYKRRFRDRDKAEQFVKNVRSWLHGEFTNHGGKE